MELERIILDPNVMAGRPGLRGTRVPVSVVLKLLAGGMSREQILADYPYLESGDIDQSVRWAPPTTSGNNCGNAHPSKYTKSR